jgi:hypothetical protein
VCSDQAVGFGVECDRIDTVKAGAGHDTEIDSVCFHSQILAWRASMDWIRTVEIFFKSRLHRNFKNDLSIHALPRNRVGNPLFGWAMANRLGTIRHLYPLY